MKTYYRGTNNVHEPALLMQGLMNKSINHLTGDIEPGLSVSDVSSVGEFFNHMYLVTGEEIGLGTDGEPLLDLNTAKFLQWLK